MTTSVGTSTIDRSQPDLDGAAPDGHLLITRNAATPSGDPVVVDLGTLADATVLASVTVSNGATAILSGALAAVGVGTTLIIDGGTLELRDGALLTGRRSGVTVHPGGGELRIGPVGAPDGAVDVPVRFSAGAAPADFVIDFPGATSVTAVYDPTTLQTTIGDGVRAFGGVVASGRMATLAGNPFGIGVAAGATGSKTFTRAEAGTAEGGARLTGFLPGAMIATPEGERAVQTLAAGDAVLAVEHGRQVIRRLAWTASQAITVPEDQGALRLPVRIRRQALADGVPQADLLLTPEHCLLLDGRLVPVRMLVNGCSILIETERRGYSVHHVGIDPHGVIMANGLLTESDLDTGDRGRRRRGGVGVRLPMPSSSPVRGAAAPLEVSRAMVEPLWEALATRAEALGYPVVLAPPATLTDEADLRLVSEDGGEILPLCVHDGRASFLVPGTLGAAWLRSRSARPSEVIGPFVDDRRELGLLVGEVAVWQLESRRLLRHHLAIKTLSGWHAPDAEHCRWTDGNALLPLAPDPDAATLLVEVQILGGGPYLVADVGALATAA